MTEQPHQLASSALDAITALAEDRRIPDDIREACRATETVLGQIAEKLYQFDTFENDELWNTFLKSSGMRS